jgi:hypothetical protein
MNDPIQPSRKLPRRVVTLIMLGAIVQLVMSGYYLFMAHAPAARDLPAGYVAADADATKVQTSLSESGAFAASRYKTSDDLQAAIRKKEIYGGVDLTSPTPILYTATAAGPSAAAALRTTFTQFLQRQNQGQVQALVAKGQPVPTSTLQQLAATPTVVDVVPLPPEDSAGSSLGLLVQSLAIGATVASTGLGKIGSSIKRSTRRGLGHVAVLVAYAAASAAVVLVVANFFGVTPEGSEGALFLMFFLLSLAITGSVSGLVALIGPIGANLGTAYFLFGVVISGASVLPEFLPASGQALGQALPTGAGATAIRDALYFPHASVTQPVLVLSLYAGIGLVVVLIKNILANQSRSARPLRKNAADHGSRTEGRHSS